MNNDKKILVGVALDGKGGVDGYIYKFIKVANNEGFTCDVLTTKYDSNFDSQLKKYNANLLKIDNLHNRKGLKKSISQLCKTNDYIAAYWNISTSLMYPYVKAAQDNNIKTNIVQSHTVSTDVKNKLINTLQKNMHYIYRLNLNKLNIKRAAVSNLSANWMFGKSYSYIYVPEPVDALKFQYNKEKRSKYREKLNIKDEFVVGCTTSFLPAKNPLFITEVMHELQNIKPNSKLIICGDGPLLNDFKKLCEAILKPGTYKILGYVNDVPDLLQTFDSFIFPSKYEGLGMALVEAQASSLPCIFSNNLPKEAQVNKNLCFAMNNFDSKAWAKKLKDISESVSIRSKDDAEIVSKAGFCENSPKVILDLINI